MADTRALLAAADGRDPDFGTMLRVIAATGARRGEVCALRWSDLDAQAGVLTIRRSLAAVVGGPIEKDTKTHAARRIALDRATLEALAVHRSVAVERAAIGGFEFDVGPSACCDSSDRVAVVAQVERWVVDRQTWEVCGQSRRTPGMAGATERP